MSQHQEALDFALELATMARGIALACYNSGFSAEQKADKIWVTEVDKLIEKTIREKVLAKGWGILGEEYGAENIGAKYVVVLDPIDGTNHFMAHDGNFFTLIGVHHHKDGFVAGVCDQPTGKNIWTGLLGQGAFCHTKDQDGEITPGKSQLMTSSCCSKMEDARLASYDPLSMPGADKYFYQHLAGMAQGHITGGDAGNYARLAEGYVNVVLERVGGLHDVAAFIPMFRECGAVIRTLDEAGQVHDITLASDGKMNILAASNADLLKNVVDIRAKNYNTYACCDKNMPSFIPGGRITFPMPCNKK